MASSVYVQAIHFFCYAVIVGDRVRQVDIKEYAEAAVVECIDFVLLHQVEMDVSPSKSEAMFSARKCWIAPSRLEMCFCPK